MSTIEMEPTKSSERIQILDVLRGFALMGVLLVNLPDWAWETGPSATRSGLLHETVGFIMGFLFEGRFLGLFSILFGIGFAIQIQRARAKGGRVLPIYFRRLAILLVFGLLHALIYPGDILVRYALLGVLLPVAFRLPPRAVLAASIACVVLVGVGPILNRVTGIVPSRPVINALESFNEGPYCDQLRKNLTEEGFGGRRLVYEQGDFTDVAQVNICRWSREARWWIRTYRLVGIFGFFLIGLFLVKIGFLSNLEQRKRLLKRVMWAGAAVGFALLALNKMIPNSEDGYLDLINRLSRVSGDFATTLAYGSAVILAFQTTVGKTILTPLASVGRMALTAYLAQSVIATTLFYGYGLGWGKSINTPEIVGVALGIYVVLIPFCNWWLRHFRFGPLEWVWRSLTYGSMQPMRNPNLPK